MRAIKVVCYKREKWFLFFITLILVSYTGSKYNKVSRLYQKQKGDCMLKLEIKLDEDKIIEDHKYKVESIYQALEQSFAKYQLRKEVKPDGTMFFYGNGRSKDYGAFGCIITSLRDKAWFMDYVTKWVWYNSDDGDNEEDFVVEDVLYHYTRKMSVA